MMSHHPVLQGAAGSTLHAGAGLTGCTGSLAEAEGCTIDTEGRGSGCTAC